MADSNEKSASEERTRKFVEKGAKWSAGAVGGAAGGAVGWLATGDPGSAATGAVIGGALSGFVRTSLANVLEDVSNRFLSSREEQRVSLASYHILSNIYERLLRGERPRDDEFFDRGPGGGDRSPAEELFEGALIKCKNAYQEKKIRHLESIIANTVFRPDVTRAAANALLNIADRLTYRQMCLLAIVSRASELAIDQDSFRFKLQSSQYVGEHAAFMKQELADLGQNGFFDENRGSATAYLSAIGRLAAELMGLNEIPIEDLREVRANLP